MLLLVIGIYRQELDVCSARQGFQDFCVQPCTLLLGHRGMVGIGQAWEKCCGVRDVVPQYQLVTQPFAVVDCIFCSSACVCCVPLERHQGWLMGSSNGLFSIVQARLGLA